MRSTDILIVDDEMGIRELLSDILQDEGYGVALAEDATAAKILRAKTRPAMVLLDIWMPDCDGITLLKEWAAEGLLDMPVVMMSGHASIDTAVEATKIGAMDFLEKPIALQKLLATVQRALKYSKMQESTNLTLEKMGQNESIQALSKALDKVGSVQQNIILVGEPGSPFSLVAESLQKHNEPWIAPRVDQWHGGQQDWLRSAHNGTLYLGDIAEYDREAQANLVQTLQKKEHFNVRIISACSCPLQDLITSAEYDSRLMDEIAGATVTVPPLREQLDDLVFLVNQILVKMVESKQVRLVRFTTAALNTMRQYNWPGNMEQLRQVIKILAINSESGTIDGQQVVEVLAQYRNRGGTGVGDFDFDQPLRELREEVERRYFEYHIQQENSNMSQVAQRVGLERTHLYRKLKQLGIQFARRQPEKE